MLSHCYAGGHISADLMRLELGVIQLLDSILHVLIAHELHNSGAIVKHISVADVACFTHMIFEILPAAGWWETCVDQQHIPEMAIQTAQRYPEDLVSHQRL